MYICTFAHDLFLLYKILIFCVEFQELSHLTRDLSKAEKKINVITSWANAQTDIDFMVKVSILNEDT